eukprot:468555-Pleurochrysis_carterae.AAC.3
MALSAALVHKATPPLPLSNTTSAAADAWASAPCLHVTASTICGRLRACSPIMPMRACVRAAGRRG